MLFAYPAKFHIEKKQYWVEFPDLPGCQTYGNTLNQTIESAQEALAGYLLTLLEEKMTIPVSSDIQTICMDTEGFTTMVSCDINQYKDAKAVKKTLTIPAWLNHMAIEKGLNFSKVLQEALLVKIQSK